MKKRLFLSFITTLLPLFFTNVITAQVIPQSVYDIITKSDCIFEGTVIRSDSYWGTQNRSIYTSHTLQIHKIFKGDMVCGTVEVITEGGEVGDIRLEVSHNLELSRGQKGIFACRAVNYNELPQTDYYPETNSFALEVIYGEQGFIKYYDDGVNRAAANLYYSFDSLAQVYDLVELYAQLNYTDCDAGNIPDIPAYRPKPRNIPASIYEHTELPQSRLLAEKRAAANDNRRDASLRKLLTSRLTYTFENVQITGTGIKYLEFDVHLKADDNLSYFDAGWIEIPYNPATFGTDIVTNGKVTITNGIVIANTWEYDPPLVFDAGTLPSTTLLVVLTAKINPPGRYNLTTVATQAVHIKIQFLDCTKPNTLMFADSVNVYNNSFYTTTPNAPTFSSIQNFQTIDITDSDKGDCFTPTITDFFPKNLNAGVGDILNIQGVGFGTTQGNGAVFLKNANDGGLTFTRLDRKDSVLWSDTLIRVYVPSAKDTLLSPTNGNEGLSINAGSGEIKLRLGNGVILTTSSLPVPTLFVGYSCNNFIKDAQSPKRQISLVDAYGPSVAGNGGYTFKTKLKTQARAITEAAINQWVCLTNVHFILGDTLSNWTKTGAVYDSTNVIQFGNLEPSVMARTKKFVSSCISNPGDPQILEIDIIIKDTVAMQYFLSDTIPLGWARYDFYEIILHELGHAHNLGHTIHDSLGSIMYYNATLGPMPASMRKIKLLNDSQCKLGGDAVISHSQTTPHTCWNSINMQLLPGVNCSTNGIPTENNKESLRVYPNPVTDKVFVKILEMQDIIQAISIKDLNGSVVKQYEIKHTGTELDFSTFPPGVYILGIEMKNGIVVFKKIIKI